MTAKITVTPVDGDSFTLTTEKYEVADGCLFIPTIKPGEPIHIRIFPLSALREITIEEEKP